MDRLIILSTLGAHLQRLSILHPKNIGYAVCEIQFNRTQYGHFVLYAHSGCVTNQPSQKLVSEKATIGFLFKPNLPRFYSAYP